MLLMKLGALLMRLGTLFLVTASKWRNITIAFRPNSSGTVGVIHHPSNKYLSFYLLDKSS